ncbi:MAG: FtsW/RodA/SpoVE family cell cycle protein [Acutalibacteraceae bacterium]|nr:FtsW/RodA/SpoVE family cell cycle protein [Acutalibacteraceae bacterium]
MDFFSFFNLPYIGVVIDFALLVIRLLLPILAIIIFFQCFSSMGRHRRDQRPLIMLVNNQTGEVAPVYYWENSLGKSKAGDIVINDNQLSPDHAVLLRRKEGWFINDVGSRTGTYVNGEKTLNRTPIKIDDVITLGSTNLIVKRTDEVITDDIPVTPKKHKKKIGIKPSLLITLIAVFHFFLAVEASLCDELQDFTPFLIWGLITVINIIFYNLSTKAINRVNFELEALAMFMSGTGVMLLVRQELRQSIVQTIAMVGGMICFCIIIKLISNPDRIEKFRIPLFMLAILFLGVNLVLGEVTNGAANWINIGGISVQPSEFVKVIYILVSASALDKLLTKKNLFIFIVFSAMCVGALAIMSDLGTALIFFCTFVFIAALRSGANKTIILAIVATVFAATIMITLKPYIADRFSAWGKCFELAYTTGYQQSRVLTHSASGGLIGVGVGNGYLKQYFASESDLVFGILCEELGLIIAVITVVCIIGLTIYSRAVTTRSRSTFYSISANCAAGLLLVQTALNVFGATDILPLTGVTLPFISLGGSSMISCWCLLAFIKAADERTYAVKRQPSK